MSTALNRLPSITLGNLRKTLGEVINRATFGGERLIITRNGRHVAAIVSVDDLRLLDELELRADVEELRAARAADDGARFTLSEVLDVEGVDLNS